MFSWLTEWEVAATSTKVLHASVTAMDMPSKDGTDLTQPVLGPRLAGAALDTAPITTDAESVDCRTDFTDTASHQALKSGSVRGDNVAIHRFCTRCSVGCRTVIAVVSKADSANGIPGKGWLRSTPKCGVSKAACVSQCWFKYRGGQVYPRMRSVKG